MSVEIVNCKSSVEHVSRQIAELQEKHKYIHVEITRPKRNEIQNALLHVWITLIAEHMGLTITEAKCLIKLDFGVPILREKEKFNELFNKINFDDLGREDQLSAMKILPVTSQLRIEQMTRLLDEIMKVYAEQGLILRSNKE